MADEKTPLCFIVGPIGEAGSPVRKLADLLRALVIRPVAEEAGYRVKRADEDARPGSIGAAVINDVLDADLVVADLTGWNPNAFYELGIRHAAQKPTIHLTAEDVKPPFDNLDQRLFAVDMSDIESIEAAKRSFKAAVEAVGASGYKVTNPVSQARGSAALAASPDPRDQQLLALQNRISALEAERQGAPKDVARGIIPKTRGVMDAAALGKQASTGDLAEAIANQLIRDDESMRVRARALDGLFRAK